jgi:non-specific serine/threonine protein kinase
MIGQTISHYKILEKLGEGGMGVVYKAQDTKLDRFVALKFLPFDQSHSVDDKARFIREAKSASALDHPNICTIYEIDEAPDGHLFIAMAAYEGETLHARIAPKGKAHATPLPIRDVLTIALQIAEGLQVAHNKGIVHRDIKSSNIIVTASGQVKIMDFGLAWTTTGTRLTKAGVAVGTVPFMSPEQARGEAVDHRSDIWSLGVVIYEMTSGILPFKSQYNEAVIYSILNEHPQPLTSVRSDVPMDLERIVTKTIQKNPGERYQSLRDMIVDLKKMMQNFDLGAAQTLPTVPLKSTRSRITIYSITAVLILIAGLLFAIVFRRDPTPTSEQSIAVLPFQNFSRIKEDDYFIDGMTESIITDLGKFGGLLVIGRQTVNKYKGKTVDFEQLRNDLNVRYVVEGSIRRTGNALRVSAQLTDLSKGVQLWADRFDRRISDLFAVEDEISVGIMTALRGTLTPREEQQLTVQPTRNLEAYDFYLRGRYYYHKRSNADYDKAIPLLEKAVTLDPTFALAYATLGSACTQKSFYDEPRQKQFEEKAYVAIEKALSIDPNLAEAYIAKGNLLWTPGKRFLHEEAIAAFRHAIELKENSDEAHEWLGFVYMHLGLFDMAMGEYRKALTINPGAPFATGRVGMTYLYDGKYQEALSWLRKIPEDFNPETIGMQTAIALFYLGKMNEAVPILDKVGKTFPEDPFLLSTQAMIFAADGKREEALDKITKASEREKTYLGHFHHAAYNIGSAYALMKKNDLAVQWLQKAADEGFPCYPKYENDPNLNNLRADPQFVTFMNQLRKQWERYKAKL